MTRGYEPEAEIAGLRRALPYMRLYRGRTFVVKAGGALMEEAAILADIADQLGVIREFGIKVVLVHGGGPQATAIARRLGVESVFVAGRRITTPETLEAVVMTLAGVVSTRLLAVFRSRGIPALGLSGVSAGLLQASRRPLREVVVDGEPRVVDYGQVGDLQRVDPAPLFKLLEAGFLPVVSPLACNDEGQVLNVNADTAASRIAQALGAEKLIFLTETPGLLEQVEDRTTGVSVTDLAGLASRIRSGAIQGGMLPKVEAASEALRNGVRRVHLVGWGQEMGLLREVFTNAGAGTLLVRDLGELKPEEQAGGGDR